ncbi:MAG: PD-(D/E)XK nuclease family protein [Candidatus Shapirobacteria bacterium]
MRVYQKRQSNLYVPGSKNTFRISRSKIDLFIECPRCFYLDRRLGLSRPSMPAFTLNSAVDSLLKNEFDLLRKKGEAHMLMKKYSVQAIPFNHPDLPVWRDDMFAFTGARVLDQGTNLEICGIIDDLWVNKQGQLLVVDYKSTSTNKEISLDDEYKQGYKRQAEIYQWIFRRLGFKVSNMAYFVFANAGRNKSKFDGLLEFELSLVSHAGDDTWVKGAINKIKDCLEGESIPSRGNTCEYCLYREYIKKEEVSNESKKSHQQKLI